MFKTTQCIHAHMGWSMNNNNNNNNNNNPVSAIKLWAINAPKDYNKPPQWE